MASRVEYAVSMTPIRMIDGTDLDFDDHDVIASDIGKSLGGSASVATTAADHTTVGYAGKIVEYGNCPASGKLELGSNAAYKMIFIKNTGKKWGGDATTLGDDITDGDLLILYRETASTVFEEICRIPAGGVVVLPNTPEGADVNCKWNVESSGSDSIAVEYALIS